MNPQHALVREHIRAGGRACALEAGVNGQMITLYDQRQPHPAGVDAPDPGDARRPRAAQRAERDVRRGDGVLARHQARRDPPGPAHLRHHVLPGAGPHERVQRASVQGAVRLRPQRARGRRDGRPRAAARRDAGDASSCSPARATAATRTCVAIADAVAGRFDHYICRRDDSLRGRAPTKCRGCRPRSCRRVACPAAAISVIPDEQEAIDAALAWASRATCCWSSPMR